MDNLKNKKVIAIIICIIVLIGIGVFMYINQSSYGNEDSIDILDAMEEEMFFENETNDVSEVDINEITKESELRQKGKIAELALGYQGGVGALVSMGAYNMNLSKEELIEIVRAFRSSNTNIVNLWRSVEKAFIEAVKNKSVVHLDNNISFIYDKNILFIKLPSGRMLSYIRPKLEYDYTFNKYIITYEGTDSVTKKQTRLTTYASGKKLK